MRLWHCAYLFHAVVPFTDARHTNPFHFHRQSLAVTKNPAQFTNISNSSLCTTSLLKCYSFDFMNAQWKFIWIPRNRMQFVKQSASSEALVFRSWFVFWIVLKWMTLTLSTLECRLSVNKWHKPGENEKLNDENDVQKRENEKLLHKRLSKVAHRFCNMRVEKENHQHLDLPIINFRTS